MCAWDQYEIIGVLGKGKYGLVSRARHRKVGKHVALKSTLSLEKNVPAEKNISSKTSISPEANNLEKSNNVERISKEQATLYHEARILAKLSHPALVALVEICVGVNGELVLALEDLGGTSLTGLIQEYDNQEGLCQCLVGCVAGHIGKALSYLHSKGILHRDVKPDNIMVEKSNTCFPLAKLIDFGLSLTFSTCSLPNSSDSRAGTLSYMAPELMSPNVKYGPQIDVFSLGSSLYFSLTGTEPFTAFTSAGGQRTTTSIYGLQALHEETLDLLKTDVQVIIRQMLEINPEKRCSIETLLESKWVCSSLFHSASHSDSHNSFSLLDSWLTLHKSSPPVPKCLHCSFPSKSRKSSTQSSVVFSYCSSEGSSVDFQHSSRDHSELGSKFSSASLSSSNHSESLGLPENGNKVSNSKILLSKAQSYMKSLSSSASKSSGSQCRVLGVKDTICKSNDECDCSTFSLDDISPDIIAAVAKVLDDDIESVTASICERPWGEVGGVYNLLKMKNFERFLGKDPETAINLKITQSDDTWRVNTL